MSTYMVDGKKMMNICILEILRKYTDSEHTMDQKDIIKKLETEYGMKVDRKSVKSNLMNLVDFGYNLECTEIERENKNGEIEILTKDWYYNHEFDDAELRMLIDSILFSKTIPKSGTGADREDQGAFECVFQCEGTACVQSAGVITYR